MQFMYKDLYLRVNDLHLPMGNVVTAQRTYFQEVPEHMRKLLWPVTQCSGKGQIGRCVGSQDVFTGRAAFLAAVQSFTSNHICWLAL